MKYIILDRDGVINEDSDDYIKSPDEFILIEGSPQAIARLNRAGYTVLVATNQSGIARGYFTENTLHKMHEKLQHALDQVGGKVERIVFCPHGPGDQCDCRKPKPGMLQALIDSYALEVANLPVVGDSLRDLQAALAVGARPILVKTGKGLRTLETIKQFVAEDPNSVWRDLPVFEDLAAAVDGLLRNNGKS